MCQSEYYLNHAHVVVDGQKEILDGAILIQDGRIKEVLYHSVKEEMVNQEIIDIKGGVVLPSFVRMDETIETIDVKDMDAYCYHLARKGVGAFVAVFHLDCLASFQQLEHLKDYCFPYVNCLGFHLDGPFLNPAMTTRKTTKVRLDVFQKLCERVKRIVSITISPELEGAKEVMDYCKKKGIKVFLGNSSLYAKGLEEYSFDAYRHFYENMTGFNATMPGVVNDALLKQDRYIDLDVNEIDPLVLSYTLHHYDENQILLMDEIFSSLRLEGTSLMSLVKMTSLNAYRLYGKERKMGGIIKGKEANLLVFDTKMEKFFVITKGEVLR